MAGDWIKMRPSLLTSPKVNGIARHLEEDRDVARKLSNGFGGCMNEIVSRCVMRHVTVASLMLVWGAANDHTEDGVFKNADLSDLDDIAGIPGFGRAMESVGWAVYDEGGNSVTLPNFNEYNTTGHVRSSGAKSAAQRQREYRERKKADISNVTSDVTNDVTSNRREDKRREEVNTPPAPQEGDDGTWDIDDPTDPPCEPADIAAEQPGKRPRKAKTERTTFATWLQGVKSRGEKPITEFKALWEYADAAGLPGEFIELAWLSFSDHYLKDERAGRRLYADWKGTFLNAVKSNYRKLWFWSDRDNAYRLTTVGQQFERALRAKEAA